MCSESGFINVRHTNIHLTACLHCKCHAYNQESIVNNDEEILRLQRERERERENTTENKHWLEFITLPILTSLSLQRDLSKLTFKRENIFPLGVVFLHIHPCLDKRVSDCYNFQLTDKIVENIVLKIHVRAFLKLLVVTGLVSDCWYWMIFFIW